MSSVVKHEFHPKNMAFRRLGASGLRVPVFSLGGWLTLGGTAKGDPAKDIIKTALDHGVNMFDTAENYEKGQSEREIGRVIHELGLRRSDIIVTTKIFWGTRPGPNNGGLSRKHIIEGTRESLERLQLDYVDVIFAHRADINVPMEEVVRAFNWVIEKGWVLQSQDHALDFVNNHSIICRRCTGAPLNGLQLKLKRLSSYPRSLDSLVQLLSNASTTCSIVNARKRNTTLYTRNTVLAQLSGLLWLAVC